MDNQSLQNGFSLSRDSLPGQPGGLIVEFKKKDKNKPRMNWDKEDQEFFKKTGFNPKENVDMIEFTYDGGLNQFMRPVRRIDEGNGYFDDDTREFTDDILKYPRQWERYQKGMNGEDQQGGYSLKIFFANDPAKVEHYKYFKIYSVEQLASIPETVKQHIGLGAVKDSAACKDFLQKIAKDAPLAEQAIELERLKEKTEAQQKLIEQLLEANKEKKAFEPRGRPKKKVQEVETVNSVEVE